MFPLERVVHVVDSHTEGEPTRIVTGGLPPLAGRTIGEQREWLAANADWLRVALVGEPRGYEAIVVAYLLPPLQPADAGVVFCNDAGYLGMCGHGAIGVATVLVAMDLVAAREPETTVRLDTPAGLVSARVRVQGGRPRSVALRNVPAYATELDRIVPVEGLGKLRCDVAWGGNWFAFVSEQDARVEVARENLDQLMDTAFRIRRALHAQGSTEIDHVKIYKTRGPRSTQALTLCPGRAYDRSPCGTGTSAKLAVLHARGELGVGEELESLSILGTRFQARILETTKLPDGRDAVVPEIEGRAFVTGLCQFVFDPDDPLGR
jgi:proline racemase